MIRIVVLIFSVLLSVPAVQAQYTLAGNDTGQPIFQTYSQMNSGVTYPNQLAFTMQYYNFFTNYNVTQWKLTVRLTQDFVNQSNSAYSVGAQYAYLQYNNQANYSSNSSAINVSSQWIQLNKYSEVTLIESNVPINAALYRAFNYNLKIVGGNHLLLSPNGMYRSAYEFKLYKVTGGTQQLIGIHTTAVGVARFQLNYAGNNGQSVVMQNGAQVFNLAFNNPSDYNSEKSLMVVNGLKVTSDSNYQLMVRASGTHLTSPTTTATIPVSVLKTQLTTSNYYLGLTLAPALTLSATDQVIATKYQWISSAVQYNLRFFIPANSPGLNVAPGTYTTHVYFIVVPF